MHTKKTSLINAGPLLLVLFIDGMGLGLVFPILNDLIFDPNANFLPTTLSPAVYNILYGIIIGIFMLCWFFGAAVLGDLSDQIGRKKSLMICLIGAFLSYLLSAYAVKLHSITFLIIGRVIAGFTSGSQPIAQAAIIDMSEPEEKTQNIGYILLAISLGFIFGPLFGGVLSNSNLISWFNFATPFYFAALISFSNIIILQLFFHETVMVRQDKIEIKPHRAIEIFISAFKFERIRNLSILFFIYIFGWSSFYSFISLYLLKFHNFDPTDVGIYMAVMGIGFGIGNGYLANFASQFFSLSNCFRYFTLATVLCVLAILIFPTMLVNWIVIVPLTTAIATSYPCILTLFSDQVDDDSQGWVMGITGAIMAFVWAINGIIVGFLAAWDPAYPLYVAAIFLFLSVVLTKKLTP